MFYTGNEGVFCVVKESELTEIALDDDCAPAGDIELFAQNTGHLWEFAKTVGALVVFCGKHVSAGDSWIALHAPSTLPAQLNARAPLLRADNAFWGCELQLEQSGVFIK